MVLEIDRSSYFLDTVLLLLSAYLFNQRKRKSVTTRCVTMPTAAVKKKRDSHRRRPLPKAKRKKGSKSNHPNDSVRFVILPQEKSENQEHASASHQQGEHHARTYNSFIPPNPLWQSIGERIYKEKGRRKKTENHLLS
jgi:hypothetical protein